MRCRHHHQDQSRIETDFGLVPGTIWRAALASPLLHQAVTGKVTDEQWRADVAMVLAGTLGQQRAMDVVARWSQSPGTPDPEVLHRLAELRQVMPVVLLTNATSRLDADLQLLGLSTSFDAIVNSSTVGACKPDEAAFAVTHARVEHLLGWSVPRARVGFVDDTATHVVAATSFGWTAHQFQSITALDNWMVRSHVGA